MTLEADLEIEEDIRDELFWSPFVDDDQVRVTVENGIAQLAGVVDTPRERLAAVENAVEGGAIGVENKLRLTTSLD